MTHLVTAEVFLSKELQRKINVDTHKNCADDINQGESEDKYFFFLPFCRFS